MIRIRRFNESDEWDDPVYHTSEITKEDIGDVSKIAHRFLLLDRYDSAKFELVRKS